MLHLMRIDRVELVRDGQVVYQESAIANTLHFMGEYYCLAALFTGGNNPNTFIPDNYYIGLDNRDNIATADTFQEITGEPVANGYARQVLSASTGFSIDVNSGYHRAVGNVITFTASNSGWGPVRNIFLCTSWDNDGYLISTARLSTSLQPASGDSFNMRMSLALRSL